MTINRSDTYYTTNQLKPNTMKNLTAPILLISGIALLAIVIIHNAMTIGIHCSI